MYVAAVAIASAAIAWIAASGCGEAAARVGTARAGTLSKIAPHYGDVAGAINLRPGDVPGFTDTEIQTPLGSPVSRVCTLPAAAKPAFTSESTLFETANHSETVESLVEIAFSAKRNLSEYRALSKLLQSGTGRRCLGATFNSTARRTEDGEEIQSIHRNAVLRRLRLTGTQSDKVVGYAVRYIADITRRRNGVARKFEVHSERVAAYLVRGAVTVSLFTAAFDQRFPRPLAQKLIRLLNARLTRAVRPLPGP